MNSFQQRTVTGTLIVGCIISAIYFSPYSFGALFLLLTILGLLEFYGLMKKANTSPQIIQGTICGGVLFITNFLFAMKFISAKLFAASIFVAVFILITELYRKKEQPFINLSITFFGLIYIAFPFSLLNYIVIDSSQQNFTYTPQILLGLFFLIWSNDTFAYLTGMALGKHRLFERISPKKTWEGSIGGGICSLAIAWLISLFFNQLELYQWLVIALIAIVVGTYGDLVESLLKRSINVKDSGNFLPGHGGILDRFDSLIVATPIVFAFLWLSN